ncbi:MAG: hypothetical protein R3B09_09805 [Nannocystaceae bacterium]
MSDPGLADALLRAPIAPTDLADEPVPGDRSSRRRRLALRALVSAFVAYHVVTLLLHVLPNGGLAGPFFREADALLRVNQYMRASSNVQSWSMFAPNPFRANIFVRAFAVDQVGKRWDLGIDIRGRRSYPYVVYDRIAKVNRRLAEQTHYVKPVGAWLCREWERMHGGESALRIEFFKLVSDIPRPESVYQAPDAIRSSWTRVGFDPLRLPVVETRMETVECAVTVQAQLPPALRARLGLPPAAADHYLPLATETWWTATRPEEPDEAAPEESEP